MRPFSALSVMNITIKVDSIMVFLNMQSVSIQWNMQSVSIQCQNKNILKINEQHLTNAIIISKQINVKRHMHLSLLLS